MSPNDGVLSLSERFEGVERTLDRIETKLDQKVGYEYLAPIMHRIELLETGESPLGKHLLGQFTVMQQQLSDVTLHGSQHAQEAIREIDGLKTGLSTLETASATARALVRSDQERDFRAIRIWGLVLSACTTAAMMLSTFVALSH